MYIHLSYLSVISIMADSATKATLSMVNLVYVFQYGLKIRRIISFDGHDTITE